MAVLQCLSAFFAMAAAFLWLISAMVKTPESFPVQVVQPQVRPMQLPKGLESFNATYTGYGRSPQLNELGKALRRQSRWSSAAACCAGVSAILQAITLVFQVLH